MKKPKTSKATPPQPLAKRKKPSRKYPKGAPRCHQWEAERAGKFWQCPLAARPGFQKCGTHGAGYPVREKRGERKNPKTARLTTGKRAKPATLATLNEQYPWLEELYREHLMDPAILDLRPQLARAKALYDAYLRRADLNGEPGELLKAADAIETIGRVAGQVIAAQKGMGAILPDDLQQLIYVFRLTIREFIDPDKFEAAEQFMREAAGELAGRLLRRSLGADPEGEEAIGRAAPADRPPRS